MARGNVGDSMSIDSTIARRDAIAQYRIIGEVAHPHLTSIAELAAVICGVSSAVINIIDDRFQHQIAAVGLEPEVCAREDSMCAVILHEARHVKVVDAREDARFANNPFVTGEIARVRLYASSPVVTPSGIAIGTLCVFDEEPGELEEHQSRALNALADRVVDVLELRRTAEELRRSNEQLLHFASQVSHDLRNPLTALSGFLELAEDDPGLEHAPLAAESIGRARSVASRMNVMVVDFLDYARAEGTEPRREPVDLAAVVAAVVEDLHAVIDSTGAAVTVESDAPVVGDPTLLRALLQNLIGNAVKFSAAAGSTPRVEVRVSTGPDGRCITVDDNGPGIPESERERVFGIMQRGVGRDVPGLGIGLATCRRIVESHRGRIGVEDSPLGGTRVRVDLPSDPARSDG